MTAHFARRSADPQTVADLTADTFVQAITSFATFDPRKGTPRAWVFGIARRIYAAHCQAHSQQRSKVERLAGRRELAPDEAGELIDRIDAERAGRALVTGLTALPAADRAVVELVDLAGLRANEAAQVLGVTPGTARMRLMRARARLRKARRRARRPVWLATGAAGAAAAATAAVMALGSAPAMAAYSVTRHGGTVSVSVDNVSGVAGANAALHGLRARVVVVQVRAGCPPIGSLPRPRPAPHLPVWVKTGVSQNGHRSVTVKIKGGIPRGDTMILAFSGDGRPGHTSLGAGGIITGPVPRCVSLPAAPHGGGAPGAAGAVTQAG